MACRAIGGFKRPAVLIEHLTVLLEMSFLDSHKSKGFPV